jgi:hypothetical protein
MGDKGTAFVKGGCGCLLAFLVIGFLCVLVGGSMHIDLGGAILLFVIGGVIGLVFLAVYNKGQHDAVEAPAAFRSQRLTPQQAERDDLDEMAGTEMRCSQCGARVNPATGEGLHSPVAEPGILLCDTCQARIGSGR